MLHMFKVNQITTLNCHTTSLVHATARTVIECSGNKYNFSIV